MILHVGVTVTHGEPRLGMRSDVPNQGQFHITTRLPSLHQRTKKPLSDTSPTRAGAAASATLAAADQLRLISLDQRQEPGVQQQCAQFAAREEPVMGGLGMRPQAPLLDRAAIRQIRAY